MAATYIVQMSGIPLALANESLLALFNGSGSGKILKVYNIWLRNSVLAAQTGSQNIIQLNRINAATASNYTTPPVSKDSSNASLPSQVIAGSKFTVTVDVLFRRVAWSNDEPVPLGGSVDEAETFPWMFLWDCGFADANVEPLVLREGFGLSINNVGLTATAPANAGVIDAGMEFTAE